MTDDEKKEISKALFVNIVRNISTINGAGILNNSDELDIVMSAFANSIAFYLESIAEFDEDEVQYVLSKLRKRIEDCFIRNRKHERH